MKNISKYIPLLLLVTLFCGCDEDAIDPLTGKYPIPVEYTLNNLQSQDVSTLSNERYLFTLELTDDKNVLHLEMVGDLYYLPGQTYTLYVKGAENTDEYGGKSFCKPRDLYALSGDPSWGGFHSRRNGKRAVPVRHDCRRQPGGSGKGRAL